MSDDQPIGHLAAPGLGNGLQLIGEGGSLQQLTKRVIGFALEGAITGHLGYEKHDWSVPAAATTALVTLLIRSDSVRVFSGPVRLDHVLLVACSAVVAGAR